LSKQSNQQYRKEKEKDHLKKAGIDTSPPNKEHHIENQAKLNNELKAPIEKTER